MTENQRMVRRVTFAPVYMAVSLAWLASVLYVVIGNVVFRDTKLGVLAQQIERLPSFVSKPTFILCWCLFFLGWIIPLALGIRRLFRHPGHDLVH
jgi:hypothetical protein